MKKTDENFKIIKKLNTPAKIQDFLNQIPFNFEKDKETYRSAISTLKANKAHCLEGALIAALALKIQGHKPTIMDLKAPGDIDHVVTLYKVNGYYGAISKTNHACLRFRDPIYKNPREVALSYFHEYFLNSSGQKTLRSYSKPLDLDKVKLDWIESEDDLWDLPDILDNLQHYNLVPNKNTKFIRRADPVEKKAGEIVEWKK